MVQHSSNHHMVYKLLVRKRWINYVLAGWRSVPSTESKKWESKWDSLTKNKLNKGHVRGCFNISLPAQEEVVLMGKLGRTNCSQLRLKLLLVRRSSTCLVSCREQSTSELTGDRFFGATWSLFGNEGPIRLKKKSGLLIENVISYSHHQGCPQPEKNGTFMTTIGWNPYMPFWNSLFLFRTVNWACSFAIHRFVSKVAQQFGKRFQGFSCHFLASCSTIN